MPRPFTNSPQPTSLRPHTYLPFWKTLYVKVLIHPFPACHHLCWHSTTWNDTHCPHPSSNPQAFSHFLRMFSWSSCLPPVTYFADNWPEYDSYLHIKLWLLFKGILSFFGMKQNYSRVGALLNPVPSGLVCRRARWTLLQCAVRYLSHFLSAVSRQNWKTQPSQAYCRKKRS